MPRISPLTTQATPTETRVAYSEHKTEYNGRITNMKATLAHSLVASKAYMQWYPCY